MSVRAATTGANQEAGPRPSGRERRHDHDQAHGLVEDDRLQRGESEHPDQQRQPELRPAETDQPPEATDSSPRSDDPRRRHLAAVVMLQGQRCGGCHQHMMMPVVPLLRRAVSVVEWDGVGVVAQGGGGLAVTEPRLGFEDLSVADQVSGDAVAQPVQRGGLDPGSVTQTRGAVTDSPGCHRAIEAAARPLTVAQLTAASGLNHNAIRQHLAVLCRAGLAVEDLAPPNGPGRRRLRYRIDAGHRLPTRGRRGNRTDPLDALIDLVARQGFAPRLVGAAGDPELVLERGPFTAVVVRDPRRAGCRIRLATNEGDAAHV